MALIEGTVVFRGAPVPEALVRATSFRGDEPWAHVPRTVRTDVELDAEVVDAGRVEWCGERVKRTQLALEPIVVDDDRGDDGARRRDRARACTQPSERARALRAETSLPGSSP